MKIRTERKPLADTLAWVTRVIGKSPMTAELAGVHVKAADGVLTLRAFDFETAHQAAVVADVTGDGECLVPGLFLRDAIAGSRGAEVELVLDAEVLTISSGRSTYRLRTLQLGDYPMLPDFPTVVGIANPDVLRENVAAVLGGADDASPNQNVRGLRIEGEADALHLVGTDGFRLHAAEVMWDHVGDFEATLPGRAVEAALKPMADAVEIGYDDGLLGLSDGTRQVTTRTFTNQYADWRRVVEGIASKVTEAVTVESDELLAAVKQVGSMTAPERPVVLELCDGDLVIETGEQEAGEGSEVLATTGEGAEFRVGVNPRYLTDLLGATSGGPVELRYSVADARTRPLMVADPTRPGLTLMLMSKDLDGGRR